MPYHSPDSLPEALKILEQGQVTIIAGGTDFYPSRAGGGAGDSLLDVTGVPELGGITRSEEGWRIGGAATWSEVANWPFPSSFDGLRSAAREVGSAQIQNAGTVAGNICNASPAADGVPPLLALEAEVETVSSSGAKRLPLEEFVVGPRQTRLAAGEIVIAVHVPSKRGAGYGAFLKLGSRRYLVISIAMVAANVDLEVDGTISSARIAVGACSPVARRLPELERASIGRDLNGLKSTDWIERKFLSPLSPLDDVRGSAEYRILASAELCRRTLELAVNAGSEPGT